MKIKEPYSTILYIIFGILLAFTINQGLAFALNTDLPIVAVQSGSMEPTFYKGDLLVLQGVNADELKVGDVIVFSYPGGTTPVVHRIIEINPDGSFQTKGDNNNVQLPFEKKIKPEQIHGKSVLIIPLLGWVKIGATEYILKFPNIILVAVIVIVAYILFGKKEEELEI
jgi:signal peptidase